MKMSTELSSEINILYRDNSIVVAVKPRGYISESAASGNGTGSPIRSFPDELMKSLSLREIFPVHRLDRETEGIMVYALSASSASNLSSSIQDGRFIKGYDAWIHGVPESPEGSFRDLLFKDSRSSKVYVVKRERKGVRSASLSYKLVETVRLRDGSLISHVNIVLDTGRTHQIRVQFGSRRMPVLGDRRYGSADNYPPIALSATSLTFPHPDDGRTMSFSIPFNYNVI